ncbi:MAG TPA: 30S ribosomal protein THX [Edaphocola sp.]|nr:30S ribosomal protein THX [Edaphocola sp.]
MGKGDKRSFRGKIVMGSYGKNRPRKPVANTVALVPETVPVAKEKKEEPAAKPKATAKKAATTVKDEAAPKKKVVKKAKPKDTAGKG